MAAEDREQTASVIAGVLSTPRNYSFVQAVRLLTLHGKEAYGSEAAFLKKGLKVVPELSLGHPSTDLVSARTVEARPIAPHPDVEPGTPPAALPAQYELVATFLALYGSASPLPTFYTEELLDEARADRSSSRDFLDIFNQALYELYYRAFNRYKLGFRTVEQRDARTLRMQYCLLGVGGETLRTDANTQYNDLRYIELFARQRRSAHGLRQGLLLQTGLSKVEIEECVPRQVPVPVAQRCCLGRSGARLGEAVLGKSVPDMEGKFRIHLYDLSKSRMITLGHGGQERAALDRFVRQYVLDPLEYDVVLHADAEVRHMGASVGQHGGRLGRSAFLNNASQPLRDVTHYNSRF